jgi:streptogramin lyase
VYRFRSAGAARFRCAFDSSRLHPCAARYVQRLAPGRHVLFVQAVSARGERSRITRVAVLVLEKPEPLTVSAAIPVGDRPGVPAAGEGAVWVPGTGDGVLTRVDPSGAVTGRFPVLIATPAAAEGFLDSSVTAAGSVWVASDFNARIARVDPATGALLAAIRVPPRPGGLAAGAGSVWAFHFLSSAVTRVDPATGLAQTLEVPGAQLVGLAVAGADVWVLSLGPMRLLRIAPATGSVLATVPVNPRAARVRSFIPAWWLAAGSDGALWATHPDFDAVTRTAAGAVTTVPTRRGRPFGVAVGEGAVWVATDRAVVRVDPVRNVVTGAGVLPAQAATGFAQIAAGSGAVWVAGYDTDALYRITP